jgi:D-lactate dehydrogenase (cytochrome)
MSFFKVVPSRAITRSWRRTTIVPSCLQVSQWTQYRPESTNKSSREQGSSFKGQLYDSTAARLEREREERARFSRERDEGSGGRSAALTFGAFSIISIFDSTNENAVI